MRFGKKGKLLSCYVCSYQILKRVRSVAYGLDLPTCLVFIHPVFCVSKLKKCVGDSLLVVLVEDAGISNSWSYEEVLIKILDRQVCRLRTKYVALVKVL